MSEKETRKLFYEDSHKREFEARVISCRPCGGGFDIRLDKTAFFPEGGGQYADTGALGEALVKDVQERDGIILHRTDKPISEGALVRGRLNWEKRFERMQQHSGEHMVSGLICRRFGYNNVGFHMGNEYSTMDFDGTLTKEQLKEIEREANEGVVRNIEVRASYPDKEELNRLKYRSKIEIEGQTRIIEIEGFDVCACCAPHVKSTGEIGAVKLTHMANYKGGVRITMLCGFRALRDYEAKLNTVNAIGRLLCEKEENTAEAVCRLKEEKEKLKNKSILLQKELLAYKAAEIPIEEEITCVFEKSQKGDMSRELMNLLLDRGAKICAVFAGEDGGGYRYVIGSRETDVRTIGKRLLEKLEGKGGGKPQMIQGNIEAPRGEIETLLREIPLKA